jgi:RodZ C-terminal domain
VAVDAPAQVGRLTVAIAAVRPCWISAVSDGQPLVERLLATGDREVMPAGRDLVLTVGDASAITLTLNGLPARGLGGSGEVVTVHLTPDNFREYLATP